MKNDVMVLHGGRLDENVLGKTQVHSAVGNTGDLSWIGDFPSRDFTVHNNHYWHDGLPWLPMVPQQWTWPQTIIVQSVSPICTTKFRVTIQADKLELSLDVPGIRKGSLDVTMVGYILTVSGTRSDTGIPLREVYSLMHGCDVRPTHVDACHDDGVLTVTFMKTLDVNGKVAVR